jgi:hypothetical protein
VASREAAQTPESSHAIIAQERSGTPAGVHKVERSESGGGTASRFATGYLL